MFDVLYLIDLTKSIRYSFSVTVNFSLDGLFKLLNLSLLSAVIVLSYSLLSFLFKQFAEKYNFSEETQLKKYFDILLIAVFGACLIIAFIPPIFTGIYKFQLYVWAQRAVGIASLFTVSPLLLSIPFCYAFCFNNGEKNGIIIKDKKSLFALSKVNKIAFTNDEVLLDNGNVKEDAYGVILESYDAKIKETILLSSSNKEQTSSLRKELNITRSVSQLDNDGKEKEVLDFKNKDKN